ncbi:hypothetical protein BN946_scf184662.g2 [Trametes cinnabarina]|uniref:Uncharacterized protein n=1 Tax=Pycnoporus cinnabarinus TaxID=5643 RepID=A0A060S4V5_PYCCI|nr:hypothetical protein BN946_scf184662.g2 [Trametes cinnabarina]
MLQAEVPSELADWVLDLESQDLVPAFRELPAIRLLYLQVVLANVFGSATVSKSEQWLCDGLNLLALSMPDGLPTHPKPARSLITVKKRLDLDIDNFITQEPICTVWFKDYSRDDIAAAASSSCKVSKCPRIFYRVKHDANKMEWRIAAKLSSYVSLKKTLQHLLL